MNAFPTEVGDAASLASVTRSRSAFTLEGSADLWIIFEYGDASYARTLLPDYVRLATPPPGTPPGKHPMMYSFGTHTVRLHGLPRIPMTYRETIVGVCNVELKEPAPYTGPYSLMTAATVDRLLPTFLGRLLGYPKAFRRATTTDRSFCIATFLGSRDLMCGQFDATGAACKAANAAELRLAEPILTHPVISRALWGTLLASRFEIDKEAWLYTPVQVAARVAGDKLPGLSEGLHCWPGVDMTTVGAFRSQHQWSLNLPVNARSRHTALSPDLLS